MKFLFSNFLSLEFHKTAWFLGRKLKSKYDAKNNNFLWFMVYSTDGQQ